METYVIEDGRIALTTQTAMATYAGGQETHAAILAHLDDANALLAQACTLDAVLDIRDQAEVLRYAARAKGVCLEMQNGCAALKIRAEWRAGQYLQEMPKHPPGPDRSHRATDPPPSLQQLGVTKSDSSRWQQMADVPEAELEQHIAAVNDSGKELTTASVLHLAKERKRETRRKQNRDLVATTPPATTTTQAGQRYATLVLDPPWDWGDEGDVDQFGRGRPTYATLSIDELRALPILDLTQPDAHIYLWITNRSLPKGFGLLEAWGFRYITMLTWVKPSIGMGNYFRGTTEHVLFGVRGSLPLLRNDVGTHLLAPRPGAHSAKPDAFYDLVETCSPGPWLELFSRRERPGWVTWGAEVATVV